MPKNNKVTKINNSLKKEKVSATLRIGRRKDGKSAHFMTNDALKAVFTNPDQSRWRNNAAAVLRLRGVPYEWPGKLAKA